MVSSYDDIMGEPMDVDTHPSRQMPQPTQQYAGDVISPNFPQSGLGGAANQVRNQGAMRDIADKGAKAVDTTNLKLIRPK